MGGSFPGLGRSPGGGHGNPLQNSCLENPMDRGAWQATVGRVIRSQTWLKWLNTQSEAHRILGYAAGERVKLGLAHGPRPVLKARVLHWVSGLLSSGLMEHLVSSWAVGGTTSTEAARTVEGRCQRTNSLVKLVYERNTIWKGIRQNAMAPHSTTLAWKIPWMEEPGRLQSMGSLGVGHY